MVEKRMGSDFSSFADCSDSIRSWGCIQKKLDMQVIMIPFVLLKVLRLLLKDGIIVELIRNLQHNRCVRDLPHLKQN